MTLHQACAWSVWAGKNIDLNKNLNGLPEIDFVTIYMLMEQKLIVRTFEFVNSEKRFYFSSIDK